MQERRPEQVNPANQVPIIPPPPAVNQVPPAPPLQQGQIDLPSNLPPPPPETLTVVGGKFPEQTAPLAVQPTAATMGGTVANIVAPVISQNRPSTRNNTLAITMKNVHKKFGENGVSDLNFDIQQGEIFGLIGPSGSGKSTTIKLLTGVYIPDSGFIRVLGDEPKRQHAKTREKIGYLPQLFVLYPTLSVRENLNFVASIYGMGWLSRRKRMNHVLELVELTDHQNKLASQISGGMQRRLELACALIHDPSLLFADEPTAGIDPILRAKFWQEFQNLAQQGRTLFVTTQYVSEAAYCDRVAIVGNGRLIALDKPEALKHEAMGGELIDLFAPDATRDTINKLRLVPGVKKVQVQGEGHFRLLVEDAGGITSQLVTVLSAQGVNAEKIETYQPSYDEVFVELLNRAGVVSS